MKTFQQDIPCITPGHWIRVWAGLDAWDKNRPVVEVRPITTRNHHLESTPRLTPTAAKRLADTIAEATQHLMREAHR